MTYTPSPLTLSSVNVTNQQEIADLVTFTDEIFKETYFFVQWFVLYSKDYVLLRT